jgi:hypothetical protein
VEPAFERVAVDELVDFVEAHSATPFFCFLLKTVLRDHLLPREVAVVVLEVHAVKGEESGMKLALHLVNKLIDGIPVEEAPFPTSVSVEVAIEKQSLLLR